MLRILLACRKSIDRRGKIIYFRRLFLQKKRSKQFHGFRKSVGHKYSEMLENANYPNNA